MSLQQLVIFDPPYGGCGCLVAASARVRAPSQYRSFLPVQAPSAALSERTSQAYTSAAGARQRLDIASAGVRA